MDIYVYIVIHKVYPNKVTYIRFLNSNPGSGFCRVIVLAVRCLRAVRLGVRGAASGKVADTAIFKQGTSLPFPLRIMNASILGQSLL